MKVKLWKIRSAECGAAGGASANGLLATWGKQLGELIVWSEFEVVKWEALRAPECAAMDL